MLQIYKTYSMFHRSPIFLHIPVQHNNFFTTICLGDEHLNIPLRTYASVDFNSQFGNIERFLPTPETHLLGGNAEYKCHPKSRSKSNNPPGINMEGGSHISTGSTENGFDLELLIYTPAM